MDFTLSYITDCLRNAKSLTLFVDLWLKDKDKDLSFEDKDKDL